MHLQQTKNKSRKGGGPQYYLQDMPKPVKEFLRNRGACKVVLQTRYGIAVSPFWALDKDHKLEKGEVVPGSVGHDRIQHGSGGQSIGEAIRHWFGIKSKHDFERIDVQAVIDPKDHLIIAPTTVTMRGEKRKLVLEKLHAPLSFHSDHQSKLWKTQLGSISPVDRKWAASQLKRIVLEHQDSEVKYIKEEDLLRSSGALFMLGLYLSPYLGKGYDCPQSRFRFKDLPEYICPVEIKKRSADFDYQVTKYRELPRAVVLCMKHDYVNAPDHIDFLELRTLSEYLSS